MMNEDKGRPLAIARRELRRRDLLRGGAAAYVAAAIIGACERRSVGPTAKGPDGGAESPPEAPMLASQVEAGTLPPVEERLPDEPLVVEPIERVGTYGGTSRQALVGPTQVNVVYTTWQYDPLVRWKRQVTGAPGTADLEPNVARSFDISDDGTVVTFQLRPGMRWSDGEPFTADDVVFAVEDVLLNKELSPALSPVIAVDGEPAAIEKIDDYSFRVVFPSPAGLFLQYVAHPQAEVLTTTPRHYLEQFHKKYNPQVDELVQEEGFSDWVGLFGAKFANRARAVKPTLSGWRVVTPVGEGTQIVLERNPYYWKTDPQGSQLPYIDRVTFDVGVDPEVMLLQTISGDIDLEAGPDVRFTTPRNKPTLAREREAGDFRFIDAVTTNNNVANIHLNLNHKDAAKREVFQSKDFRIGLSHAINRPEIIDVVMQRQGVPYQAAPVPESVFYDEEFATQYLEYDVDLANEHLDRVVPEKNSDGIRLDSEGKPVAFTIDAVTQWRTEWADMAELLTRYWREVGIDARYEVREHSFFTTRADANEHDATIWLGAGGLDVVISPRNYMPDHFQSFYARLWAAWYTGGEPSEEPPEATKQQMQLYDQLKSTVDADEQTDLMREILEISKDQFYEIGIVRETGAYFVAHNRLRGLPETMIMGWTYATPSPSHPEQYFIVD